MRLKDRLNDLGVLPRKSRGQNFLKDPNIALRIIDYAQLDSNSIVLEIGPGLGALTSHLATQIDQLYCVELEGSFCRDLAINIPKLDPKRILCVDIRQFDLASISNIKPIEIISNLPYSISSDVVQWVIQQRRHIKAATLLLQREFAERICAQPNSKQYGSLSVWVQLFCNTDLGEIIPGSAFHPPTKVESRLLRLEILESPRFQIEDIQFFQDVVRGSFSVRRKTIVNALLNTHNFGEREAIRAILKSIGIDEKVRAENIKIEDFVRLASALKDINIV